MYLHRVSLVISQNLRQSGFSLGFTAGWKKSGMTKIIFKVLRFVLDAKLHHLANWPDGCYGTSGTVPLLRLLAISVRN